MIDIPGTIKKYGRQVLGVFPDEHLTGAAHTNALFAYTIGNMLKEVPELLIIGVDGDSAVGLLNELSERMIRDGAFTNNEIITIPDTKCTDGNECRVLLVDADESVKTEFTLQATRYAEDQHAAYYRVMQVVIPDASNRLPGEPGCEEPYSHVIIHRRRLQ